jgi:hypothetical protein
MQLQAKVIIETPREIHIFEGPDVHKQIARFVFETESEGLATRVRVSYHPKPVGG